MSRGEDPVGSADGGGGTPGHAKRAKRASARSRAVSRGGGRRSALPTEGGGTPGHAKRAKRASARSRAVSRGEDSVGSADGGGRHARPRQARKARVGAESRREQGGGLRRLCRRRGAARPLGSRLNRRSRFANASRSQIVTVDLALLWLGLVDGRVDHRLCLFGIGPAALVVDGQRVDRIEVQEERPASPTARCTPRCPCCDRSARTSARRACRRRPARRRRRSAC